MQLKKYMGSFRDQQAIARYALILLASMVVINFILSIALMNKETVITMVPLGMTEEAEILRTSATSDYKHALAIYFSNSLGNVTPGSVKFIKASIEPFLAPEVYQDVIDTLSHQANNIERDRLSISFSPRETVEEDGKIFVYGISETEGPNGKSKRTKRTYEFIIRMSQYRPVLAYIDTYQDKPRTRRVLDQMDRKAEQRRKQEEAHKR